MNPLRQLQDDANAYMLGNPETAVVPYDTYRKATIDKEALLALGGWNVRVPADPQTGATAKIGCACLTMMPSFYAENPNVPGVQGAIELIIRTFEDPKINNTGLDAEAVALSNLRWIGDGLIIAGLTVLYPDNKGPALKPNYDFPGFLVYDTVLLGKLPQDFFGRTPDVVITEAAGLVTLACPDQFAAIYYTIGGPMPQPGDQSGKGNTLLYVGPFQVPAGTVVRSVAYNPAILPSNVDQVTINY